MADGGTVFLDEIGDISLDMQTKLLRVLQEMTFERVGSSDPVSVDVRVIAATHQDLEKLIVQGRFRQDLFYRLNVISITAPPLRDRREDIPELAAHFLQIFSTRSGKPIAQMDDDVLAVLKEFSWPGNIRQLENVIERAVVVAEGSSIRLVDLPDEILREVDLTAPARRMVELSQRRRSAPWLASAFRRRGSSAIAASASDWSEPCRQRAATRPRLPGPWAWRASILSAAARLNRHGLSVWSFSNPRKFRASRRAEAITHLLSPVLGGECWVQG